jgi:hypothetical protein
METGYSNARADYRSEALLCAIRSCAAVTTDLLARHPHSTRLRTAADDLEGLDTNRSLSQLLWQELVDQETHWLGAQGAAYVGPGQGTAVQYWQRRLRLDAFKQRQAAAARLPHPWPELMRMPVAASRQICLAIGLEMVVHAFHGVPLQRVIGTLGCLGSELAGQVVDHLGAAPSARWLSPTAAERWRDAYLRIAREVTGERIASGLGRSLLAARYRRLAGPVRTAAAALCRSNFAELLQLDQFLEPVTDEELTLGEKITSAAVAKGKRS